MSMDPFEERLRSHKFRTVPAKWRAELLAGARQASGRQEACNRAEVGGYTPLGPLIRAGWRYRLASLLWPSPRAWAALAATWLALLGLHWADGNPAPSLSNEQAPAPEAIATALAEQQRILAEISRGLASPAAAPARSSAPGPRSQALNPFLQG